MLCCQAFIITLTPGRVERSEGRAEHRIHRVTLPGPKRADPPKREGELKLHDLCVQEGEVNFASSAIAKRLDHPVYAGSSRKANRLFNVCGVDSRSSTDLIDPKPGGFQLTRAGHFPTAIKLSSQPVFELDTCAKKRGDQRAKILS
jgi:hypothetical protein